MTKIATIHPDGSIVRHFVITKMPKLPQQIKNLLIEFNEFLSLNFSRDLSENNGLSEKSKNNVWKEIKQTVRNHIKKICLLVSIDLDFDEFFNNYFPEQQKGSPDAVVRMIADVETIVRDNCQD